MNRHRPNAAEEERLEFLAEECAEVIKECMKILRHGWTAIDPTVSPPRFYDNRSRLTKELGDVCVAVELLTRDDIDSKEIEALAEIKMKEVKRYMHFQSKDGG